MYAVFVQYAGFYPINHRTQCVHGITTARIVMSHLKLAERQEGTKSFWGNSKPNHVSHATEISVLSDHL